MSDKIIIILVWSLLANAGIWPVRSTALGFGLNCLTAIIVTALFSTLSSSIGIIFLRGVLSFCSRARFFSVRFVLGNRLTLTCLIRLRGVSACRRLLRIDRVFDRLLGSSCASLSLSSRADLSLDCLW